MKRHAIELVLGFLYAIRRRDREAAADCLDPGIVWQGVVPDLVCHGPDEVLDVFCGRRDHDVEVDRLELIGTERGAVFAFHRPETWEVEGLRSAAGCATPWQSRTEGSRGPCRARRGARRSRCLTKAAPGTYGRPEASRGRLLSPARSPGVRR